MSAYSTLIQLVDRAMDEAARKSGDWLKCRPGCSQCCIGVFPVGQTDAARLRDGLVELRTHDSIRAAAIVDRARAAVTRLSSDFPGDPVSGMLDEQVFEQGSEGEQRFDEFANDEVCPVLDPLTGTCELYSARPVTCRTFGPPMRINGDAVAVCELCFDGASDEEIAACEVELHLEDEPGARTIIAFALA